MNFCMYDKNLRMIKVLLVLTIKGTEFLTLNYCTTLDVLYKIDMIHICDKRERS